MQSREGTFNKGPDAITDARNKAAAGKPAAAKRSAADTPARMPGEPEKFLRYVYSEREIDIGDGLPIPALRFHRVTNYRKWRHAREIAVARGIGFVTLPEGYEPSKGYEPKTFEPKKD